MVTIVTAASATVTPDIHDLLGPRRACLQE